MQSLRSPVLLAAFAAVALPLAGMTACDDDPFRIDWVSRPDTVVLYSVDLPETNVPGAFDFVGRRRVLIASPGATGNWDLAVGTAGGGLVFMVPQLFNIESEAGLAFRPGLGFEEVHEAPAESEFVTNEPVPVEVGSTYVIRTRQEIGSFRQICSFYGKLEVIDENPELGTVRFIYDVNPRCEDPGLVPDEDGS